MTWKNALSVALLIGSTISVELGLELGRKGFANSGTCRNLWKTLLLSKATLSQRFCWMGMAPLKFSAQILSTPTNSWKLQSPTEHSNGNKSFEVPACLNLSTKRKRRTTKPKAKKKHFFKIWPPRESPTASVKAHHKFLLLSTQAHSVHGVTLPGLRLISWPNVVSYVIWKLGLCLSSRHR